MDLDHSVREQIEDIEMVCLRKIKDVARKISGQSFSRIQLRSLRYFGDVCRTEQIYHGYTRIVMYGQIEREM